eukprot:CAMPEP_0198547608 /NCGR_PEP_ID=MMETSP1462-20131121/67679_1 /TAXON_ID=1333877 /ORGANISM="Brandtodinium nutriculum, Strain RCC3387" /LENGTH=35 /DNA_ID= /DNA_START= /DNA_END= /DNA_ORIENTATION=
MSGMSMQGKCKVCSTPSTCNSQGKLAQLVMNAMGH